MAKELNDEVAFVDPLAENWSANLREVANIFKSALKEKNNNDDLYFISSANVTHFGLPKSVGFVPVSNL